MVESVFSDYVGDETQVDFDDSLSGFAGFPKPGEKNNNDCDVEVFDGGAFADVCDCVTEVKVKNYPEFSVTITKLENGWLVQEDEGEQREWTAKWYTGYDGVTEIISNLCREIEMAQKIKV